MGKKLEDSNFKRKASNPGPANYEPFSQSNSSKYGFGTGIRKSVDYYKARLNEPGVGKYSERSKDKAMRQAPVFGFGTGKRSPVKLSSEINPGPGAYENHVLIGIDS